MPEPDVDLARKLLSDIRRNRRSQSPDDLAKAARSLGFEVDSSWSKDSRWWAIHPSGRKFPIPTTNNAVRVGTTTSILRVLEEVLNDVSPG